MAVSFAVGVYLTVRYPILQDELFERRQEAFFIGIAAILLTIEGLRRTAGWNLVVIMLSFLLYALFADHLPNPLDVRVMKPGESLFIDVHHLGPIPRARLARPSAQPGPLQRHRAPDIAKDVPGNTGETRLTG